MQNVCAACGAVWPDGQSCQDGFHQLLFWENEYPGHGRVHHLMVLCYYLQHPSLYSAVGLRSARELLRTFLEDGVTPEMARQRFRREMGGARAPVTARPDDRGAYPVPVAWPLTVADVVAGGAAAYCENVAAWAQAVHDTLTM
ncbi:MAG: hypothetical protein KC425_02400 [Anaerolineales bacterium]|nr:hypothetical protein [Anaerolineales bacterium]